MIDKTVIAGLRRLASRANPRIKEWAGLKDKDNRDALGLTLAEGANLVAEGLRTPDNGAFKPQAFLVSDSGAERAEAGGLLDAARAGGLQLFSLTDDCYEKISGLRNSDGLALVMAFAPAAPDLPELFAAPSPFWLVAAGVQDPGNAGALARTALAAGVSGCLFLDGSDLHSPKFLRGSMGAAFRLPCRAMTTAAFIAAWKPDLARLVVATTAAEAEDYRRADYTPPLALLVGGERGIPEELAALSAGGVRIPLHGGVESLNLAVAAGILLFEAESRRGNNGGDVAAS